MNWTNLSRLEHTVEVVLQEVFRDDHEILTWATPLSPFCSQTFARTSFIYHRSFVVFFHLLRGSYSKCPEQSTNSFPIAPTEIFGKIFSKISQNKIEPIIWWFVEIRFFIVQKTRTVWKFKLLVIAQNEQWPSMEFWERSSTLMPDATRNANRYSH